MKRLPFFSLVLVLSFLFSGIGLAAPSLSSAQTYTVLVGAENVARKAGVMQYFPSTLHIHVGDTVVWKQNTHEIHTVTFLAGEAKPTLLVPTPAGFNPAGLMINPQVGFPTSPKGGLYDGSTFANSGVMSTDPGQPTHFSLTFTKEGSFQYICVVHGMMMSGTIIVDAPSVVNPSPAAVSAQVQLAISAQLGKAYSLFPAANAAVPLPTHNPDGTTSYTVLIGWSKGAYDLMSFFPENLNVHPGDTVTYKLSPTNTEAPHTVTFLNGGADIPFVIPTPNPPSPLPVLLINPQVLMPINPGKSLTRTGVFSSGLLNPLGPGPYSWTITIGNINGSITYQCLLHDSSGMIATLNVTPR